MAEKSREEILGLVMSEKELKNVFNIGLSDKTLFYVNTGHYGLNLAVSGFWDGGWPGGRVTEVFGDPSTGKSILMLRGMASMQRGEIKIMPNPDIQYITDGAYVFLDDTEKAYVSEFCTRMGLDKDALLEFEDSKTVENHFEKAMLMIEKIRKYARKETIGVFLDSVAQLSTTHEIDTEMDKADMTKAKMVHKAMRKYSSDINNDGVMYLIANHVTDNIGGWGSDKVVKGGSGIAFQSSVRVDLHYKTKFIKNEMTTDEAGTRGEVYGTKIVANCVKNKITTPFKFAVMDIYFDKGLDAYSGLFDHFSRQGRISLKENAKGGPKPVKAKYGFEGIEGTFLLKDLPQFIIDKDILGIKARGGTYMVPLDVEEPQCEVEDKSEPVDDFLKPMRSTNK